jgi:hypothetical protein
MSAAELHAPARAGRALWHYLRLFGRHRAVVPILVTFSLGFCSGTNTEGFEGFVGFALLMALLPLVQWGASTRRGELDHAMPLGRARHDLLWLAAGAAWAVVAMIPPLALMTALWVTGPSRLLFAKVVWFPLVILAAGLACYLVGAGAWLRGSTRPGLLMCVLFALCLVVEALLGSRWARVQRLLTLREAPAPGEGPALLLAAALLVAAAGALAWLMVAAPRWRPRRRFRAAPRLWPVRPAAARLGAGVPRRPARLHAVLWGELRLLSGLAAVAAAVATLWVLSAESGSGPAPGELEPWVIPVIVIAFWLPMLVWLRGRGPWRRRVEPVPVGALAMRLARVAAGAVCLELVLAAVIVVHASGAAGGLRSAGSYAAVAGAALLAYLMSSFPQVLARDHLLGWSVGWTGMLQMSVFQVAQLLAPGVLSPRNALLSIFHQPDPWVPAMLLWLAVVGALLVWTAWIGVIRDRGDPIPGFQVMGYQAAVARAAMSIPSNPGRHL